MAARAPRLRRACLALAAFAATWSFVLSIAGGILLQAGALRLSSRNPMPALVVAALAIGMALAVAPAGARWRTLSDDGLRLARAFPAPPGGRWTAAVSWGRRRRAALPGTPSGAALAAGAIAIAVVAFGIGRNSMAVVGSDSYGYVSYARLWATGVLRVDPPLIEARADPDLGAAVPPQALAPLGYRLRADQQTLAPTYSPGLPLLMGAVERAWGPRAVFLVVPVLAGLGVWLTYRLGRRIGGPPAGAAAAALMAASPVFLQLATGAPMSDIPAMAWWTLMLVLLPGTSRRAALGAGLAAGAAILTRPNLAPLAIVPGAALLWLAARERRISGPAVHRLLLFGAGVVPACLVLAWLNAHWFGSPLLSGYGPLGDYFHVEHLAPNVVRYPWWLLETQTPIVLLAAATPLLVRRRRDSQGDSPGWFAPVCGLFALAVFASYAFYLPFEHWSMLRLLLPAFPVMLAFTARALGALDTRVPAAARLVVLAGVVLYGLALARLDWMREHEAEQKYAAAGRYIVEHLPERAVFLTMQHSGTVRYYTGRAIIRYDELLPEQLDRAIGALRRLGYHPYFLLDEWEEPHVRARHGAANRAGALDWPPAAVLEPGGMRLYDLARLAPSSGEGSAIIPVLDVRPKE